MRPGGRDQDQVLNITDAPVTCARRSAGAGNRVALPRVEWDEVDEMRVTTRGGFGSTGM
jgi:dUTPase